jgi:hypothetical protein
MSGIALFFTGPSYTEYALHGAKKLDWYKDA